MGIINIIERGKLLVSVAFLLSYGCYSYTGTPVVQHVPFDDPVYIKYTNPMSKKFLNITSAADDMALGLFCNGSVEAVSCNRKVSPLLVTTFVNLNTLKKTSPFGRAFSELLMTQLQGRGYVITEMRVGNVIDIKNDSGEFVLTRDVKDLLVSHSANAIVAGTYTITKESVILNGRLISLTDNSIIASWTNSVVRTKEINSLLTNPDSGDVSVYERVPHK
ncbi:MAG: hypothetical protein L3V56_10525 [Candidatus Magnetoovum sp. WYHC-5]|nr:hypothetical protein [Candidatus Magnetoovum sp. WYHC-5]